MKRILIFTVLAVIFAGLNSCSKNSPTVPDEGIPQEVLNQISALNFSTDGAYAVEGGYIVENDIFLSTEDLHNHVHGVEHNLIIADEEQYRTTNLVTGLPRTIEVSSSGDVSTAVSNAINAAIGRYNAQNLGLTFLRVASDGDINIKVVNGGNYIASAGFPSGGNPYPEVKFNRQYQNWQSGTLTSVIAHEIGHCIGFRHTDYMNRAYSCGGAPTNEGSGGVGAVHIPGTPTGPDAQSWMLSCIGNGIDRPFNNNDRTALGYLY